MFDDFGHLIDYWHVLAISSELKKGQSTRKFIYELPILSWRDSKGTVHSVLDVCAHKRSQLKISNFVQNEITCPYHGWKYSQSGALIEIPSSPEINLGNMKCQLRTFQIKEEHGLIWISLTDQLPEELPFSLTHELNQKWGQVYLRRTFETSEELLIENFMDATHTAFIHEGIIRGHGEKTQHHVKVTTNDVGLMVSYAETTEEIGVALGLILGKNLRVKHTDEFLFPNLVKVTYVINDITRFTAVISCTSSISGKTEAIVRLSFNFKWLNPIIKNVLPIIAKKVLDQDFSITKQQFENQQVFNELKDHPITMDMIYNKIKSMRKAKIKGLTAKKSESSFSLYL